MTGIVATGAERRRLRILYVTPLSPGQGTIGAERRIQGVLAYLNSRHDVTAVSLVSPEGDPEAERTALAALCRKAVSVPSRPLVRLGKRFVQLRSLVSRDSFSSRINDVPALQRALDEVLTTEPFDVVNVEFPYFFRYQLRKAPPAAATPRLVLDEHNIEHDLVRQMCGLRRGIARHLHNSLEWRKVRREEVASWKAFDGVTFTSTDDERRARALVPSLRARVVPNGVDMDQFRARPDDPPSDGRTVLFFGTFNYYPNVDGATFFLREIWPLIAESHPQAQLKLVGADPSADLLASRSSRVQLPGRVSDIRRHIAEAAVVIVPLRIGGGTRLKVLESMAMSKAIVSTRLGAEGIEAIEGQHLLRADDPPAFARAVGRLLDDPELGRRLGSAARELVQQRYSWQTVGQNLENFYWELLNDDRPAQAHSPRSS